ASADHDARRVASRRAALVAQMQSLARAVARRVPARAQIAAEEADVVLETGDGSRLRIGPGKLSLTHPPDRVALEVTPAAGAEQALGLRVGVPLGASDARTIDAKLDGGPIALNLHGEEVVSGDMRLRTSLQLSIPLSTKKPIHLEGSGSIRGLQLTHPRIADQTLAFPEVAWKGPVDLDTERFRADFRRLELNLGDARAVLNGHIALPRDAPFDVDVEFEIPIVTCQQAFDAIPQGMTPSLDGAKFEGSIHAQGHARFTLDSRLPDAKRLEGYSMGWTGDLSCRASHMPAPVRRERFRKPFDKLVYSPERVEKTMTFGPTTPQWTPLGSISRFMVASVLTTEDGRFFRHSGFDQEAIVNSIEANLRAGRFVRGASTISMQLAKNLYLPRTKTISRKLEEAILTIYLEQTMTKEEMMEMYLNIIEYGPMVYGIGPAARHYFRKSAGRLSLGQAMYLASILPSPNVHHFGAGGAVNARYMSRLHAYMKVTHKIGRISDEELEEGLRETAVLGQPAPLVTRPLDESNPYEEAVDPAP
ncbi:MAG: biosynthetic peptidoglycan transglycosylase, partial [Myxococcota bacterium]